MAKSPVHPRRRRFIKLTATGLVVAPLALALCSRTSSSLPRAGALHGAADTPGRNDMHLTE